MADLQSAQSIIDEAAEHRTERNAKLRNSHDQFLRSRRLGAVDNLRIAMEPTVRSEVVSNSPYDEAVEMSNYIFNVVTESEPGPHAREPKRKRVSRPCQMEDQLQENAGAAGGPFAAVIRSLGADDQPRTGKPMPLMAVVQTSGTWSAKYGTWNNGQVWNRIWCGRRLPLRVRMRN